MCMLTAHTASNSYWKTICVFVQLIQDGHWNAPDHLTAEATAACQVMDTHK
jgi:hypothetical protein